MYAINSHYVFQFVHVTVDSRIGDLESVIDGTFGEISAPVFLDGVGCDGTEQTLVECPSSPRLGFIDGRCACNKEDCVEDLGVKCPGNIDL